MIEQESIGENKSRTDLLGQLIKGTPWFRGKNRLIQHWFKTRDKSGKRIRKLIDGYKIICDLSVNYEAMVWLEQDERVELNILRSLLNKNQIFVDCGANIGLWTLTAASVVGPTGRVYAFEPNKSTFEKLEKNISSGKYIDMIQLFCAAVGSKNTNLPIRIIQGDHNICHMTDIMDSESILVPVVTLDSTLKDTQIDGIKIDVEGFELEVLKGAANILKKSQPWLFVEFNTWLAKVNILQQWEVHKYLREIGYVCCQCKDALKRSPHEILPDNWQSPYGYCNLFYWFPN